MVNDQERCPVCSHSEILKRIEKTSFKGLKSNEQGFGKTYAVYRTSFTQKKIFKPHPGPGSFLVDDALEGLLGDKIGPGKS